MDNAAKVPHGLTIVATNSGYRGTWQERWRDIAVSSGNWKTHIYFRPAPWLDPDHVEESKRRNSIARFNRLFYGIWPKHLGDALDESDITAAIDPNLQPQRSKQHGISYVAALDLGIKQDHSALIVIGANRETLQLQLASCQSWAPDPSTGKVNLMKVEQAVLREHRAFDLKAVGYDPHQAALMSQRLELQKVRMQEMVFTGEILDLMASTLLDVFRTRRITMFEDKLLLADLGKLCIEERPFGYKLTAVKDEFGHADRSIALSIALPLAVEQAGVVPLQIGAWSSGDQGISAFETAMKNMEYRNQELQRERDVLEQMGDDASKDPIVEVARLCGRI
jgi:hypothetical protein